MRIGELTRDWLRTRPALLLPGLVILYFLLPLAFTKLPGTGALPQPVILGVFVAAFALPALLIVVALCYLRLRAWHEVVLLVAGLLAFLIARPMVLLLLAGRVGYGPLVLPLVQAFQPISWLRGVGDVALIFSACFLGRLVSRLIRERSMLLPVAIAAAAVDFWGVYWGFVAHVQATAPEVASHFSAAAPMPAPAGKPLPSPEIGAGDFIFLAFFFISAHRFTMNERRTFWLMWAAMAAAAVMLSFVKVLPGLVFIGLAFVIANWRDLRLNRREWITLGYAALVIAAVVGVIAGLRRLLH
jgi:hypothetical protein